MGSTIRFFDSICVPEFRKSFLDFSKVTIDGTDLSKPPSEIRNLFFEYFKTDSFLGIYQKLAGQLNDEYNLANETLCFQLTPTPRVFTPGAHGTNWHCDYWYGHGKNSKTVWVPILNIAPGSTFNAIKNAEDNYNLYNYYSKSPELLSKKFDLMNAKTTQVCPGKNSAAIFETDVIHGSTENTTTLTRLSFDFRFTTIGDETSTKNINEYLYYNDGKLLRQNTSRKDVKFLKYICGGRGIDTKAQHILIEASCNDLGLNLVGQEAEIERFDFPMLKFHVEQIQSGISRYSGIVIVSKKLFDKSDMLRLLSKEKIPIFFALEQEWFEN